MAKDTIVLPDMTPLPDGVLLGAVVIAQIETAEGTVTSTRYSNSMSPVMALGMATLLAEQMRADFHSGWEAP